MGAPAPAKKVVATKKPAFAAKKPVKAVAKKAAPAPKAAPARNNALNYAQKEKIVANKKGPKAPVRSFGLLTGDNKLGYYPKLDPKRYFNPDRVQRNPYQNNAPVTQKRK